MPLAAGDIIRSSIAPGWVTEGLRNTSSPTITTTETVVQSVSFAAVTAARYKITALQSVQSTVAGDLLRVRLRYAAGGTVTSTGTELLSQMPNADVAGKGWPLTSIATVTGLPAGTVTVGVTLVRESGTGNVSSFGDARQTNVIMIERV